MIRPGSALSKQRQQQKQVMRKEMEAKQPSVKTEQKKPTLDDMLAKSDFVGALTLLKFEKPQPLWSAYCHFHNGDYDQALELYEGLLQKPSSELKRLHNVSESQIRSYKAVCLYALQEFQASEIEAKKAESSLTSMEVATAQLLSRILFHCAHKRGDDKMMTEIHSKLKDSPEDQLCIGAVRFLRSHYQDATDVYKRLLVENKEHWALNVYIAMCYYKLDYFDVAVDILQVYLSSFPTSLTAINLKACCTYQLFNGKAAEQEYQALTQEYTGGDPFKDHDILRHNQVVFRGGEGAMQVLPSLVDIIPEARLNLVVHYLKTDELEAAYELIKDVEPVIPREYILKGVVLAGLGQRTGSREHNRGAQQLFQLIGGSPQECDTIPGRQCMASCFFLLQQFDDVLVYLKSIRAYFSGDDDFLWNIGLAFGATGQYKDCKEALLQIQSEKLKGDFVYLSWLCRAYIMCGEAPMAWAVYAKVEPGTDAINLLHLIANDCYRVGEFYVSCRSFDVLEKLDPTPEYWDGKRGSAIGVFQKVVAGEETPERLKEVIGLLKSNNNPQVEYMINRVMKRWAKENGINLE